MNKKPWLSKTIWMNLILAIVAFIPSVGQWFAENPSVFIVVFSVANIILRLVTKGKIELLE